MTTEETVEEVDPPIEEPKASSARGVLLRSEKYVAWLGKKAEIDARLARVQAEIDAAVEDASRAEQRWQVMKHNALISGEPIPPKPEPVDRRHLDEAYRDVWLEQRQHGDRRGRAVVAAIEEDGGLETLRAQQEEAYAAVLGVWEETLGPLLQGFAERAAVVREYEREKASGDYSTVGAPRMQGITSKPDLYDVLQAAQSGRSLLEPAPVAVVEGTVQRVDEGYGLKSPGQFASGYEDSDRPAPSPLPAFLANDRSRGVL